MKNLKDTKTFKRIIIAIIIITIFSFFFSNKVEAKDSFYGGKLLNPVVDLIVFAGDGLNNLVHAVIYKQSSTIINVDMISNVLEVISTVLVGVVITVVVAAACVATAGAIAPFLAGLGLSAISAGSIVALSIGTGVVGTALFNSNLLPDDFKIPVYQISPEEIFSNRVNLFDVDFFNPNTDIVAKDKYGNEIKDSEGKTIQIESTAKILRGVVSNWYTILRDISIVALLSVLVYTGIRILLSSTSGDKAKYKQMLLDWIVAICLLFVMQYIMSFSNMVVERLIKVVSSSQANTQYTAVIQDENGKIEKKLKKDGMWDDSLKDGDKIYWPTNLMGMFRIQAQYAKKENASYAGHAIMFVVLVFFTIYFIFTYLKRVIYMAFLTIIAPLVALTYPIDKMNDGKAQAFNMWLKEYIFNLLIQPLHLLLYTILVTSAFKLASESSIYSLVVLGFMIPAEKLMRKFFGFEKAQTPGLLAGPAGAAATMGIMNKILGKAPHGKQGKNSGGSSSSSKDSGNSKIHYADSLNSDALYGGKNDDGNIEFAKNNDNPIEDPNMLNQENPQNNDNNTLNGGNSPENSGTSPYSSQYSNNGTKGTLPNSGENIRFNSGVSGNNQSPNVATGQTPIEDKIYGFGRNVGQGVSGTGIRFARNTKDAFNGIQFGQGFNNARNRVSNSRPMRTIKNSRTYNAGKAAAKYYGQGMKEKMIDKINNSHPIKSTIRTAAAVGLGATAGGIALAAGVAGGDPNKAVQYTVAAATAGYATGKGISGTVTDAITIEGTKEAFEEAYYGPEQIREKQIQERQRQVQKDSNKRKELEMRLKSKEKADEAMKMVAPACVRYDLDNANEIAAVYNQVKQGEDINRAMTLVNEVKERGKGKDLNGLGHKDRDDFEKTIHNRVNKNKPNEKKEVQEQLANNLIKDLDNVSAMMYERF